MAANIEMEKRERIFTEMNKLLREQLGDNGYMLVLAYEGGETADQDSSLAKVEIITQTLSNLNVRSQLISWKGILTGILKQVRALADQYSLQIQI
jgi:hypothetical protein